MENYPDIQKLLTGSGIRSTKARLQILEHLSANCIHPNTEELKEALSERGNSIPAATLYQSLEKLSAAGLLIKFLGFDGQTRYDANLKPHHHLICTTCNKIIDVHLTAPLSQLTTTGDNCEQSMDGWAISDASIEMKGICPDCSR